MRTIQFATLALLLIVPISSSGIAIAQERLPFIGTKYFNFIGESGTEESITIEKDGTATLKFYGLISQGVIWKGKFSNPLIPFSSGNGLLFKDEKVYGITGNGELRKGCKSKEKLCESSLSDIAVSQQEKLPFIGTKYFNFPGGSGTWQSITIEKDGTAILRFYSVSSQSVTWKGKFSNPLIESPDKGGIVFKGEVGIEYPGKGGLLFKGDKVYETTVNGEIRKGCKGEGTLCETSLSSRWRIGLAGAYVPSESVAQTLDPRKVEADELLQQGITQSGTNQIALALSYFQQTLGLYREIKDRQGEAIALDNLGRTYRRWGNNTEAIDYFQQVLAIGREVKDHQNEKIALDNLGETYTTLAEVLGEGQEGLSLSNLGRTYAAKAIGYHQQALALAKKLKDWQGERTSLTGLGQAHLSLGNYDKAIDYLQQVLALARKNKDGEVSALGNLGLPYLMLGDYSEAIDYFQKSLAMIRKSGEDEAMIRRLGRRGGAYGMCQ